MSCSNQSEGKKVGYLDLHLRRSTAAVTILQYSILQRGWGSQLIQSLGGSVVPFVTPYDPALVYFSLAPYPTFISALALRASTKHVAWILGTPEKEMTPSAALMIGTSTPCSIHLNDVLQMVLHKRSAANGDAIRFHYRSDRLEPYVDAWSRAVYCWPDHRVRG